MINWEFESHVQSNMGWSTRIKTERGTDFCHIVTESAALPGLILINHPVQLGSNKTFAAAGSCSSWFRDRWDQGWDHSLEEVAKRCWSRNIWIGFRATSIELYELWIICYDFQSKHEKYQCRSGNASHVWPSFLVHFWWVTRRAELLRDFIVETRWDIKSNCWLINNL